MASQIVLEVPGTYSYLSVYDNDTQKTTSYLLMNAEDDRTWRLSEIGILGSTITLRGIFSSKEDALKFLDIL